MSKLILNLLAWVILNWQPLAMSAATLFFAAWLWHWYGQTPQAPVGLAIPATVADAVRHVDTVEVKLEKPIAVYGGGEKTKKKLALPDAVIIDMGKSVVSSSTVSADDHKQTVTTVIDSATGKSETFVVREALPWIAFTSKGDVMIAAGLTATGDQIGMIQARQGVLKLKEVTLGVVGQSSITNAGAGGHMDNSAMAAIWWGWGR